MKAVLCALIGILCISSVLAFGISPASVEYLNPEDEIYALRILNLQDIDAQINISIEELGQQFITLGTNTVQLQQGVTEVTVPIQITNEKNALPGIYDTGILVEQLPSDSVREFVTAIPAARHKIRVIIPSEGKFVDINAYTSTASAQEKMLITVHARNIGTEHINSAFATVDIIAQGGERITSLRTQETTLGIEESKRFVVEWTPEYQSIYTAQITVQYDEITRTVQFPISVGTRDVLVSKAQFGEFSLGQVARFDVPVRSTWNQPLPGVFAKAYIEQEQRVLESITTTSANLAPLGSSEITGYWNTAGYAPGRYTLRVETHFAGETKTTLNSINLGLDNTGEPAQETSVTTVLLAILIVLLIIIAAIVIHRRNR